MDYRRRMTVLILVLLTLGTRFALIGHDLGRLGKDVDGYVEIAQVLAHTGIFGTRSGMFGTVLVPRGSYQPTAYRPPLYPLILGGMGMVALRFGPAVESVFVASLGALHIAISLATTLLAWRLAERWQLGRWATLAAALVAVDPLLINQSVQPMTEPLAALLLVLSLYFMSDDDGESSWRRLTIAGLFLGLGMLCRTTLWSFAQLAIAVRVLVGSVEWPQRARQAATVLAIALVVQLPWGFRNWLQFGRPVLTTTHGGYTLRLGNNEVFYDEVLHGRAGAVWSGDSLARWQARLRAEEFKANVATELEADAVHYHAAWQTIRSRPGDFIRSVIYRVVSLWRIMPHATESYGRTVRLASAAFYVPVLLMMLVGLCDRRVWRWPLVLLPVALVSFTLVHAVYWSDMRMRAPIMPAVAILAALGASRVARLSRGALKPESPQLFAPGSARYCAK